MRREKPGCKPGQSGSALSQREHRGQRLDCRHPGKTGKSAGRQGCCGFPGRSPHRAGRGGGSAHVGGPEKKSEFNSATCPRLFSCPESSGAGEKVVLGSRLLSAPGIRLILFQEQWDKVAGRHGNFGPFPGFSPALSNGLVSYFDAPSVTEARFFDVTAKPLEPCRAGEQIDTSAQVSSQP